MSQGFLNEPPRSRSGAIQLRLPATLPPSAFAVRLVVRLVTSAFTRARPKSQSTAFILSSISTLSWDKTKFAVSCTNATAGVKETYCFQISMYNVMRVEINKAQGNVMKLQRFMFIACQHEDTDIRYAHDLQSITVWML